MVEEKGKVLVENLSSTFLGFMAGIGLGYCMPWAGLSIAPILYGLSCPFPSPICDVVAIIMTIIVLVVLATFFLPFISLPLIVFAIDRFFMKEQETLIWSIPGLMIGAIIGFIFFFMKILAAAVFSPGL